MFCLLPCVRLFTGQPQASLRACHLPADTNHIPSRPRDTGIHAEQLPHSERHRAVATL